MIRRLSTVLLLGVLGAALLAGCGGKSRASTTTVTSNPSAPAGDTRATPEQKQYVAACQQAVDSMKSLPAASRARLRSSCEKTGVGQASRRQLAHEVCLEQASRLASPAARTLAQKICNAK
jgi:hypothetical protein